jgi:hypothetical protein
VESRAIQIRLGHALAALLLPRCSCLQTASRQCGFPCLAREGNFNQCTGRAQDKICITAAENRRVSGRMVCCQSGEVKVSKLQQVATLSAGHHAILACVEAHNIDFGLARDRLQCLKARATGRHDGLTFPLQKEALRGTEFRDCMLQRMALRGARKAMRNPNARLRLVKPSHRPYLTGHRLLRIRRLGTRTGVGFRTSNE